MKKSLWMRLAAVFAVLMLAIAMATPAQAVKSITVKSASFNTKRAPVAKRATKVTRGTYKVKIASGKGYAKFTAPATKTYTFVVSGVKDTNRGSNGYWYIMTSRDYHKTLNYKYIGQTKVATQGGKTTTMWMTVNGYKSSGTGTSKNLPSRYAKIKLTKGETVFVYFSFLYKGTTATLKIN